MSKLLKPQGYRHRPSPSLPTQAKHLSSRNAPSTSLLPKMNPQTPSSHSPPTCRSPHVRPASSYCTATISDSSASSQSDLSDLSGLSDLSDLSLHLSPVDKQLMHDILSPSTLTPTSLHHPAGSSIPTCFPSQHFTAPTSPCVTPPPLSLSAVATDTRKPSLDTLPDDALLAIFQASFDADNVERFGSGVRGSFPLAATCSRLYAFWRARVVTFLRFGDPDCVAGNHFFAADVFRSLARFPLTRQLECNSVWNDQKGASGGPSVARDGGDEGMRAHATALHEVASLQTCANCTVESNSILRMVRSFPVLRVLELPNEIPREELGQIVAALPNCMSSIRLCCSSGCGIDVLNELCRQEILESLHIDGFSSPRREALCASTQLPLQVANLERLGASTFTLRELALVGVFTERGLCAMLKGMTQLRVLRLKSMGNPFGKVRGETLTCAVLDSFPPTLEELELEMTSVLGAATSPTAFSRFVHLRHLVNRDARASPSPFLGWDVVAPLSRRLCVLDFSHCTQLTDLGVVPVLKNAVSLRVLRLASCRSISDGTVHAACWLPELEELYLNGCGITILCRLSLGSATFRSTLRVLWLPYAWGPGIFDGELFPDGAYANTSIEFDPWF